MNLTFGSLTALKDVCIMQSQCLHETAIQQTNWHQLSRATFNNH